MVAIDNSDCSNHAVDLAIDIAKTTGARLTGNHVYAAALHDTRFRQLEPGLPERYQEEEKLDNTRCIHEDLIGRGLRIVSDSYLDVFEEKCRSVGMEAERKTPEGRNYDQLVKDANQSRYDLVAIGAYGLGRNQRSTLGSVCERVARLVTCDVLIARCPQPITSGPLLVAIDGSPDSFAALARAIDLSLLNGNHIYAVAAYDPFFHAAAFKSIAGVLSPEAAKLFRFREQEQLHDEIIDKGLENFYRSNLLEAQQICAAKGIAVDIEVLSGKLYDAIISYADTLSPALLLCGRVGIHHCDGISLGSTTENLMRFANGNILIAASPVPHSSSVDSSRDSENEPAADQGRDKNEDRSSDTTAVAMEGDIAWSPEAEQRLERVPFFARRMARRGIERFARENGFPEITPELYEQARRHFGMGR